MSDDQRRAALKAWREILLQPDAAGDAEDRYGQLLRSADDMEKAQLIGPDEWRKLVQEAGTAFADSADPRTQGWRA